MLLEIAIGDAYGAGFEFVDDDIVRRHNSGQNYIAHDRHRKAAGVYTDDTQMSLAVAEVLVEGLAWTPEVLAERFVQCFHRDPRRGYAGGFFKFLCETRSGSEFLANIRPTSDKSGAAMRAGVIGLLPSLPDVMERSAVQASLTHNTSEGIASAQAAALMTHYLAYDLGPKGGLGKFLEGYVRGGWGEPWSGFVSVKGMDCVHAAVTAVERQQTLTGVLRQCVSYGGDVDTVAAIAMGPASCSSEIRHDLSRELIDELENGKFGRRYIEELDRKLMAKFNEWRGRKGDRA